MTVKSMSRPRVGEVIELRMSPEQVIANPVCMQPVILSSFSC